MKNKGFTILELVAVIVILGVIALITIPLVSDSLKNAKVKIRNEQIENIVDAAQKWNVERLANFEEETKLGNDIVLLLDISYSMRQNNRIEKMIEAVNNFVDNFMKDNIYNRVSIAVFSNDATVIAPLEHYNITGDSLFVKVNNNYFYAINSGVIDSNGVELSQSRFQFAGGTNTQGGIEAGIQSLMSSYSSDQIPTVLLLTDGDPRIYTTNYTSVSTGTSIHVENPVTPKELVEISYYTLMTANYYKKKFYNDTGSRLNFFTLSFELNEDDLKKSIKSSYKIQKDDILQYLNTVINPDETNIELLSKFGKDTLSNLLYKKLFSDSSIDKTNYSYVDYAYNMVNYTTEGLIESLNEMVELAGLNTVVSVDTLIAENFLNATDFDASEDDRITGVVKIMYDPIKGKYVYSFYNDEE